MLEFGEDVLFTYGITYNDPITKIDGWLLNFYFFIKNAINKQKKYKKIIFNQHLIIDDEILRTN